MKKISFVKPTVVSTSVGVVNAIKENELAIVARIAGLELAKTRWANKPETVLLCQRKINGSKVALFNAQTKILKKRNEIEDREAERRDGLRR